MSFVKEDYVLGNKKIVVGDNLHDLVLENLGKIYIRYGNSYKEFNELIKTLGKATSSKNFVIETDGLRPASSYGNGVLVYDVRAGVLYLSYDGKLLELVEGIGDGGTKFVRKTGDTMSGQLVINTKEAPLKVQSAELVKNLNANLLEGHDADEFAVKDKNETITGNWKFAGENEFLKENTFQDTTQFNGTAIFNKNGDGAAIRVGTGDIITDGSLGSSMFASGLTGYGWRLNADTNTLEIDNLIVRGVLNVFELIVNKVSATNGALWITDSFEIEKVHNLRFIDAAHFENVSSLNTETYYIPYIYDKEHIFNINSTRNEINEITRHTNFYRIKLDDSTNPIATRSIRNPVMGKVYERFDFLFKINDLKSFVASFRTNGILAPEYYTKVVPKNFYYDDNDLVRIPFAESNIDPSLVEQENPYHLDWYVITIDETTGVITLASALELKPDFMTRYTFENTYISPNDDSVYPIQEMAARDTMLDLAAKGIIEFTYLYQKDPKRVDEFDIHEATNDEGLISLTPLDPDFDKQTYTVVSALGVELQNKPRRYEYTDTSYICHINLYYKYFGESFPAVFEGDENRMQNLYIVEAKNDQYPVFKPGDILRCQKFTNTSVKQYNAIVLGLVGSYGFIIELQNSNIVSAKTSYEYDENGNLTDSNYELDTALYERSADLVEKIKENITDEKTLDDIAHETSTEIADEDQNKKMQGIVDEKTKGSPQKGDALVRIGSIFFGDRQRSMMLTSSEDNSPYQDIIVNVNRPDYGVIYFTPKYKTFEAYIGGNDSTYRKVKLYFQNEEFGNIMTVGDIIFSTNQNQEEAWNNILDNNLKNGKETVDEWIAAYGDFYNKYREYSAKKELPSNQIGDTENEFTGLQKIVDVALTYQPNTHSPVYYDVNGNRIKIRITAGETIVDYFVSSDSHAPVVSTYNANNPGSVTHLDKKTHDYVSLSIGRIS